MSETTLLAYCTIRVYVSLYTSCSVSQVCCSVFRHTHTHSMLHSLAMQPLRTDSTRSVRYIYVYTSLGCENGSLVVEAHARAQSTHRFYQLTRHDSLIYTQGIYVGLTPPVVQSQAHKWKLSVESRTPSGVAKRDNRHNRNKRCVISPIGPMEREHKVAITIFSIVRRPPQINQTAGENTQWWG